jgi:hypothetical protein
VLEDGAEVPLHGDEPLADLLDPLGCGRGQDVADGLDASLDEVAHLARGLLDRVQAALDPPHAGVDGLEPLVAVRDQASDGLVPRQDREDPGLHVLTLGIRRLPDLAGDLLHQRDRGLLDRAEPLLQAVHDHLVIGGDHRLEARVAHGWHRWHRRGWPRRR